MDGQDTADQETVQGLLFDFLKSRKFEQNEAIATEIAKLNRSVEDEPIEFVLDWFLETFCCACRLFYCWDTSSNLTNEPGLQFLYNVNRHVLVCEKLALQPSEINWIVQHLDQLAYGLEKKLSL